jgi:hypothetical protein
VRVHNGFGVLRHDISHGLVAGPMLVGIDQPCSSDLVYIPSTTGAVPGRGGVSQGYIDQFGRRKPRICANFITLRRRGSPPPSRKTSLD